MSFDPDLVRALESYGHVLTTRLQDVRGPRAYFRDAEIELLERHLDHARHNSFLLVGPSGGGKTAILYELFRRIGLRENKPWLVLETSTSTLMAGTAYIGEWQTRVQEMATHAQRPLSIVVYFKDIHQLADAGKHSKSDENMAAFLSAFVESGQLTLIGECTPDSFRKGIERHPSFNKLFTVFRVEEPSEADVREIVRRSAHAIAERTAIESGRKLLFSDNTLTAVLEYGELYFPGLAAPGGAIKLLDHLVNLKLNHNAPPSKGETIVLEADIEIQHEDVVRTLESFTGIPGLLLDDSQPLRLPEVRQFFESRVIGQSLAVESVIDLITLIKAGLTDPEKPMGVLFFVGPTGVGKTELAKALAEFIFGSSDRMLRFDMSEFKDFHSFEKFIGSQNAQADSPLQMGSLLSRVRQQPFSVILLDEIEKAHANIFDLLLQVFDDGRLSDPTGRTTNFTQTIIIMTSNLGSDLTDAPVFGFHTPPETNLQDETARVMQSFFRPEFLNRIDRIVSFKPLEREHVRILAQRELGQVLLRSGITRRELRVDVDPGVIDILVREGFSPIYGARPLKRAVEKFALLPIARQIVHMTGENRQSLLRLLPSGNGITVRIVQDRQSRKQESITKGVQVVDPIHGTKTKLKPSQIEERVTELQSAVSDLEKQCQDRKLEQQKTDMLHRTTQVNFWDDPAEARDVLGEIYRLERLLEAVAMVRKRTEEIVMQFESARTKGDAEKLASVAEKVAHSQQHADLVRFSLECQSPLDRSDAFVSISTMEEECPDDLVGNLADMYLNWAHLKGFEAKIVHEDLFSPKITRDILLLIEGVAVYGMLRGEVGMHEMVYGRTPQHAKKSKFVKVRVLPVVDSEDVNISPGEISLEKIRARGTGLRCKRYKSTVTITHRPSATSLKITSELTPEEAAPLVEDLLHSELACRQLMQSSAQADFDVVQVEDIVRKYTLTPRPSARDSRTGVFTNNLNELWKGALDEFLYATLRERNITQASGGRQSPGFSD